MCRFVDYWICVSGCFVEHILYEEDAEVFVFHRYPMVGFFSLWLQRGFVVALAVFLVLIGFLLSANISAHHILQYSSTVVSTLVVDVLYRGSIPGDCWRDLFKLTKVHGDESSFNMVYWTPQTCFYLLNSYLVYWPYFLCCFKGLFVIHQPWTWRRKQHFEVNLFCFASSKWGCFGITKTTPTGYATQHQASILSWLPECSLSR